MGRRGGRRVTADDHNDGAAATTASPVASGGGARAGVGGGGGGRARIVGGAAAVVLAVVLAVSALVTRSSSLVHPNPTPLISVISPTSTSRHDFHARLYDCFAAQTYEHKELLVYDDGAVASPFFTALLRDDPSAATRATNRVRYVHTPGVSASIGKKRNELIARARGTVIAHFDDDDFYAPGYLAAMAMRLYTEQADFTKLSAWYLYSRSGNFFGFWDQTTDSALLGTPQPQSQPQSGSSTLASSSGGFYESGRPASLHIRRGAVWLREMVFPVDDGALYGYGFSYVYRKSLWERAGKFPDVSQSEDIDLVRAARRLAPDTKLDHFPDAGAQALALKFCHKLASSGAISQYRLPVTAARQLFGDRIDPYIARAPL